MNFFKILLISFLLVGYSVNLTAQNSKESAVININAKELNSALKKSMQLVDVRTPNEYKSGHITNAININYYDQDFSTQIGKLNKSKPIYVYCRSGVRSKYSSEILKKLGL